MAGDENLIPATTPDQPDIQAAKMANDDDEIAAALKLIEEPATDDVASDDKSVPEPDKPGQKEPKADTPEELPKTGLAKSWAAIQKADKQLRADRAAIKSEREQLAKQKAEITEASKTHEDLMAQLKADPLGTLDKVGLPFKQLADGVMAGKYKTGQTVPPPPPPVQTPEERQAEINAAVQAALAGQTFEANYRAQIQGLLATPQFAALAGNPEAEEQIIVAAKMYARDNGETLPPHVVAASIQETWTEHLKTLGSSRAVRELMGLEPATAPEPDSVVAPVVTPHPVETAPIETLSDALNTPSQAPRQLPPGSSDEEEIRAAVKLLSPNVWDGIGDR